MKRIPRRLFTEEFKREAIKLAPNNTSILQQQAGNEMLILNPYAHGLQNLNVVNSKPHWVLPSSPQTNNVLESLSANSLLRVRSATS